MRTLFCSFVILNCVVIAQAEPTLADLAEMENWKTVVQALENGQANPNTSQPDGTTALHWAAFHDRSDAIKRLVSAGANVNAMTDYNVSPLSLACEYGNKDAVIALLKASANPNEARVGKETPLMLAARSGNPKIVRQLLAYNADVNAKEVRQQTALMWAAAAGNVDAVDELVKGGAKIQERLPNSDFSAIMFAARQGHTAVVMRLLDAGVDVNETMQPKRTGGRDPRKGTSALLMAIESGHLELALNLVERGADPNDQRSGYAPLHTVSWVRRTELGDNPDGDPAPRITGGIHSLDFVRQMVEAGADVNLRLKDAKSRGAKLNPQKATPFLLASRGADLALMDLLLELGADPMLTNTDGTNALMAAAGVGVTAVGEEPGTPEEVNTAIHKLIKLGLDPNVVDKKRETAMHGAALRNFPSTVQTLADVGADPQVWNKKNKRGWTPHDISRGKRPGSVKPSPETEAALDAALKVGHK